MASSLRKSIFRSSGSSLKSLFINSFIGGIAWGLGSVIGATVVVAIVGWILNRLGLLDPIKYFLTQFQ